MEDIQTTTPKPKAAWLPAVIASVATALVVGGSMTYLQSQEMRRSTEPSVPAPLTQQQEEIPETVPIDNTRPSKLVEAAISGGTVLEGYSHRPGEFEGFLNPAQGDSFVAIDTKTLGRLYANGESIESLHAPVHPRDESIIFFSTSSVPGEGVNRVYAYDLEAHTEQLIFEERNLAQCLADKGAKMYGTSWCQHCQEQKRLFRASKDELDYVECGLPNNQLGQSELCAEAKILSYPTWIFSDGSRMTGLQSLETLEEKTGCSATDGLLRTVGMDGSKLIMLVQGIDDSPGPCWSPWLGNYVESLRYLELSDLPAGVKPYAVPQEKKVMEQEIAEECLQSL